MPGQEELGPLPAGRHGFTREQVAAHQRERLIAGLAEAVVEHGYNPVTIGHITKAAKVSRRAFYAQFESKEECFLAAFEVVIAHMRELIVEAIAPIPDWPHRVVAGLRVLLEFLASDPALARLCLVDSLTAGSAIAARFGEAVAGLRPLLEPGRAERRNPRPLPDSTEDSLIGALATVVSRSIASGEAEHLPALLPDFVEFVLMPYLGPDEAHQVARDAG